MDHFIPSQRTVVKKTLTEVWPADELTNFDFHRLYCHEGSDVYECDASISDWTSDELEFLVDHQIEFFDGGQLLPKRLQDKELLTALQNREEWKNKRRKERQVRRGLIGFLFRLRLQIARTIFPEADYYFYDLDL